MKTYLALLRGINVSGQKKIKMADLKALLTTLGFSHIDTYIQSGNVVFQSAEQKPVRLALLITEAIEKSYQFTVPVTVLSAESFNQIHHHIPLTTFNVSDLDEYGSKVLITFISQSPTSEDIDKLLTYVKHPEQLIVKENAVYIFCPNGYGKSKLSNNFIENKLKVMATTRNWKTMVKLNSMLVE